MELSAYLPILIQIAVALGLGVVIVAASHIFGQRAKSNKIKDSAYECGDVPEGAPHPRFGARFNLVAMLFVIFDIEIVLLLPITMVYSDIVSRNTGAFAAVMFFVAVLTVGVVYEIKKDSFNWNIPKSN